MKYKHSHTHEHNHDDDEDDDDDDDEDDDEDDEGGAPLQPTLPSEAQRPKLRFQARATPKTLIKNKAVAWVSNATDD